MKPLLAILLVSAISFSATWAPANKKWSKLVKENQLEFTPHPNYKPVPVKENRDMPYQYALKHQSKNVEVRYHIRSIPQMKKNMGEGSLDVNTLHKTLLLTAVMNISQSPEYFAQGRMPVLDEFPREAVKKEFNADRGYTGAFPIFEASEYGKGYKWGAIFVIHRKDVADATVCFLADDKETIELYMMDLFYALKFVK